MVLLWSNWAEVEQAVLFSSYYRHSIVRFKCFMFIYQTSQVCAAGKFH